LLVLTATARADEPAPAPPADSAPPPAEPAPPPSPTPPAEQAPPAEAIQATGTIKGRLSDKISEEGLPAAMITIAGQQSLATELDGTFTIALPPGTYTITFSTPEFIDVTKTLIVDAGKTIELAIVLDPLPKTATGETIEIVDKIDERKESAVLAVRRAASTVSDAVSSQEISKTPDANAGDAMKRVVAVSIVDGKYIALRGLEGRYVTSLLNGVLLPSPEPDRNAVPLDLFPTSLLATMTVYKSYSPELPGQFGGGTLAIATSSFPTDLEMRFGVSTSANTVSTGRSGLTNAYASGFRSFLGFDDGSRALPSSIPRNQAVRGMDPARMEQIGESMPNAWTPKAETVTPNLAVNAMVGDSLKLAGKRWGYLATAMLRRNFAVREGEIARTQLTGGELTQSEQLSTTLGVAESTIGALGNVGVDLDSDNQLNLLGLYSHVGEDTTFLANGFSETDSSDIDVSRMQFIERQLAFAQLHGTHKLSRKHGIELRWQGNFAETRRDELDSRDLVYTVNADGARNYKDQPGSGQHFWQALRDRSGGGGFDLRAKAGDIQLRAGGVAQLSERALGGRRFRYKFVGSDTSVRGLDGEQMFSDQHIGPDFQLEESTLHEDAYKAGLDTFAGFAMAEIPFDESLRVIAGVRYERASQNLENGSRYAVAGNKASIDRTDNDALPTANFVFAVRKDMNVRAAYSYTLVRPRFRELAPFLFFDYNRRRDISGNPDLVETHIHNADVRWEWFPDGDGSEVFAASAFGKYFRDPIEQVLANSNADATFLNADGGSLVGLELEARTTLERVTPALAKFRVGTNVSVMRSRVDLGEEQMLLTSKSRALYGQSPFVVNVNLGYVDPKVADINLLYNVTGSRISDVGIEGLPDTYERPMHRVDIVAARLLRKDLRLKLAVSNVLNQKVVFEQDDITVNTYAPGVSISLGLDWSPQ
jgi:outer membrane receptor protein involved in Fe transport